MPDSLSLAPTLQQPLIVDPGQILPWSSFSRHETVTPAELASYRGRLATFDMPGAASSPARQILLAEEGLSFAQPGSYFFVVPCGCAKVLVRQPGLGDQDRRIEIARFVSACTVRTMADYHRVAIGIDYNFASSLAKLFNSNQPLGFRCGELAAFLMYLMNAQGDEMRRVWLYQKATRTGHIVAYAPLADGGVLLDPDYGVAIPWTPQQLMADRQHGFAHVPFISLGPKRSLAVEQQLNVHSRSEWTWLPGHSTGSLLFSPDGYRKMLVEFCEQIEIAAPVCDAAGGLVVEPDPIIINEENLTSSTTDVADGPSLQPGPIIIKEEKVASATTRGPRTGADPRLTFDESAEDMLSIASPENRRHLETIFSRIDRERVAAIRGKHATDIAERFPREPSGEFKYLDLPYWISHKLGLALRLGLHVRAPIDILDLGTGASHFLAVCQGFGHRCIGTDVEVPLYADIAEALGVTRLIERIEPQTPLQDRGRKFDLVTALWISFNSLKPKDGRRVYWSLDDWRFLVEDLKANHLKRPATINFDLNPEFDYGLGKDVFNKAQMDMFKGWGATVDEQVGRITLPV
jgi:hypothetical protein